MASENTTGITQNTLDQVLMSGYANVDAKIYNNNTPQPLPIQQITLPQIQITNQNAPNTSQQNRQLTNQFLDVNKQNFDLQSQQVSNQYNLQTQALAQSQKDAQTRNLISFGQSSFVNPAESSRNLSFVTDVNAKVRHEYNNIANQATLSLNQVATNFATQNFTALNMNRQNDVQDRQLNLSEALQRGAETGQLYNYNAETGRVENTGQLNLQGKSFDASMTGWYQDYQGQRQRTLQARQIDSNLVDATIKRQLTVSDLTGLMPDFSNIQTADGLPNYAFDFTKNTGALTVQGQLNQANLAQASYTQNLYNSMNTNQLYNQEVQAKSALLDAQIQQAKTSNSQQLLSQAEIKYKLENPKTWQAPANAPARQNLLEMKALSDLADKETNPEVKKAIQLKLANREKTHSDEFGEGDMIYYRTETEYDTKGNPTKENFYYTPNALAKYGLNGTMKWETNDPKKQEGLSTMKTALTAEFKKAFVDYASDPTKVVNKILYRNPSNNDNMVVALRSVRREKDGEVPAGYEFIELNLKGLNDVQKNEFYNKIKNAEVKGSKGDMATFNTSLQNAKNIIDEYAKLNTSTGFKTRLDPAQAMSKLNEYGIANEEPMDGISNSKALSMLLLGSNTEGNKIITSKDVGLDGFNRTLNTLKTTLNDVASKSNERKINIDADKIFQQIANGNENIQIGVNPDNSPITIQNGSKEDASLVKTMRNWYSQYVNKNMETNGKDILNALIKSNGDGLAKPSMANGNPLSVEYLFTGNYLGR